MTKENKQMRRAPKRSDETVLLRNSEIRDGEFVRYYGKENEIVIPDSVTVISEGAFRNNKRLTRVSLGRNADGQEGHGRQQQSGGQRNGQDLFHGCLFLL